MKKVIISGLALLVSLSTQAFALDQNEFAQAYLKIARLGAQARAEGPNSVCT